MMDSIKGFSYGNLIYFLSAITKILYKSKIFGSSLSKLKSKPRMMINQLKLIIKPVSGLKQNYAKKTCPLISRKKTTIYSVWRILLNTIR